MLPRVVWGPLLVLLLFAVGESPLRAAAAVDNPPFQWPGQDVPREHCVAVIDTGVDYLHPEIGPFLLGSAGLTQGWDFVDNDGFPYDSDPPKLLPPELAHRLGLPEGTMRVPSRLTGLPPKIYFMFEPFFESVAGHGTQLAGIALKASGTGCILPVRIEFDTDRTVGQLIQAIRYVANLGVRVVNLSFGYLNQGMSALTVAQLDDLKNLMLNHPEMLFVTISHNHGKDLVAEQLEVFPASLNVPNKLVVSAVSAAGEVWKASNIGKGLVDLFAPGVEIHSARLGGGSTVESGTSMAAPYVAGLAAQILQKSPGLSTHALRAAVLSRSTERLLTRKQSDGQTVQFPAQVLGI